MVGGDNSACINADGSYGVVCIVGNRRIACATCRFGKSECVHVQHLSKLITAVNLELPQALQQFRSLLSNKMVPTKQYPHLSCISKCQIPFNLPNHLSAVLRMSVAERYSMCNGVAQLLPQSLSAVCIKCSQVSWSDPCLERNAIIVTSNQLLNAQG